MIFSVLFDQLRAGTEQRTAFIVQLDHLYKISREKIKAVRLNLIHQTKIRNKQQISTMAEVITEDITDVQ